MIISRQQFSLNDRCIVEKMVIAPPFRFGAVFQNEACFLYLRQGEAVLNAPTDKIKLFRQEGVLLKCGNYFADFDRHALQGNCEVYAIHLYPDVLREIYQHEVPPYIRPGHRALFAGKIADHSIIEKFIDGLVVYFENPGLVNDELLRLKVKELLLLLLQTKSAETILALLAHLFSPRNAAISEVINTHLYSSLSVEELAKLSGLSLSSFKREFSKVFNDTPANYIKKKRLEKAKELLQLSDFSVSEIAFKVGFNDAGYFSRVFHESFACAPSDYRKFLKQ